MLLYTVFTILVTLGAYSFGKRVGYMQGWEDYAGWERASRFKREDDDELL
jgi:hypothetical protein